MVEFAIPAVLTAEYIFIGLGEKQGCTKIQSIVQARNGHIRRLMDLCMPEEQQICHPGPRNLVLDKIIDNAAQNTSLEETASY